ncbi:MAG: hypothetical protein V5A55_12345 [Halovenus sp.]
MENPITRRRYGVLCALVLAGCTGDDDGGGGDNGEANPEFEEDVDPQGVVTVPDQEGQGTQIEIREAEANVDYRLVVDYDGGTVESSVISAEDRVSAITIDLDTQITSEQTVEVAVISRDGERLDSESFRYTPIPPGPKMSRDDLFTLLDDRTGWGILDIWSHFRSFSDDFVVESDVNGYDVRFEWIHGTNEGIPFVDDPAQQTERVVAKMNAAFFQAIYTSDYEISRAEATTRQFRGHEADGSEVIDRSGKVVVTGSTAASVDWDNLVENGDFPQGMRSVADEYEFTFHEQV